MNGNIIVLSGPSGSGKSTLVKRLMSEFDNIYFSISSTTRAPRVGEKNGVNYFFISEDEFKKDIKKGNFIEWALVHGNYYGTSLLPMQKAIDEGKVAIFDIDVQGFDIVRSKIPDITSVFVTTPSLAELEKRLKNRGTDSDEVIAKRLKNASNEMKHIKDYDYLLINDELESVYMRFKSIFLASKIRTKNFDLNFINQWKNQL